MNDKATTMTQQQAAAWLVIAAIRDAIREAGPNGVPSGHLYAALSGRLSLDVYTEIIHVLKSTRVVTESGHVLRYVGPDSVSEADADGATNATS